MIGGILLAEPIVWLLFERGKFTSVETIETVSVLRMYMIGLLPFGLAKLFSLFLYAKHQHRKAAKIAVYSLITSVSFSLLLMHPMGASGLALAGSIGGWVLFIFTVKEVGVDKFIQIVKTKQSLVFLSNYACVYCDCLFCECLGFDAYTLIIVICYIIGAVRSTAPYELAKFASL